MRRSYNGDPFDDFQRSLYEQIFGAADITTQSYYAQVTILTFSSSFVDKLLKPIKSFFTKKEKKKKIGSIFAAANEL